MNIAAKISKVLYIGGIVITSCFGFAIIAGLFGMTFAKLLAGIGVVITAATPVAGVIVASIYLRRAGETKYFYYALILLMMMFLAGIWRLTN
jgi:multidrug efflux pump subunit AcrA (membrane-fusion protein)